MDVEELVKRLRNCLDHPNCGEDNIPCDNCPYFCGNEKCLDKLQTDLLNALETLQAENKQFAEINEAQAEQLGVAYEKQAELRAERDALLKSFKAKPVGLEERGD